MKLLVIIPDPLSSLIGKGEITERYYNPGNLFEEVHILMTNNDMPDPSALQETVGTAHLVLHNLPEIPQYFIENTRWFKKWMLEAWAKPFFWYANRRQFQLLRKWAQPAVEIARQIQPDIIRCHANDYNAFIASEIKGQLGIPYVVSLHINPDVNPRRRYVHLDDQPWQVKLFARFFDHVELEGLRQAELALPVYQPILPYLKRAGCERYEVAYNVLSDKLLKKNDYSLHNPVRLISVGRHFSLKNPENIIRAVQELPNAHLTLIGDGPYQEMLENLVSDLKLAARVTFIPAIPNDELCLLLPEQDIFIIHSEHWELSKAMLEALLTGLPCIINRRKKEQVPELQGDFVMLVDDSKDAYLQAIHKLMEDHALREQLGCKAYAHAQERWAPAITEAKYVEIYRRVMAQRGNKHAG
jgi:glycosyltransferase involved in cell wall biosynthesis